MIIQDEKPKLGRPVSLEKREAILRAAGELFLARGYTVSMDDIAAAAGVSKQTLYGHFDKKEDLFRAFSVVWKTSYFETIEAGGSPKETLESLATQLLGKLTSEEIITSHRRLIEQSAQFPDLVQLHDEIGPRHSIALIATYLARLMAEGVLRQAEASQAAEDFLSLTMGQMRTRRLFGGLPAPASDEVAARASRAVDIFWRAYRNAES
jgi:TetR/AcrR family transcriptional regulator, mexJK operon transcriptional repressor